MNRDKDILGIHIDNDVLNIVHLAQTADGLTVLNWAAEPLEADIVKDGLITDVQFISQKIHTFIKAGSLKAHRMVISLPCSAVRLKPCELTAQTDKELQEQVEEQIGRYALFGGREVIFDYCTFEGKTRSHNKQMVLQAITTRQTSDNCLEVARNAGLELVRIEPSVLAIIKLTFNKQVENSQAVSLLLALDSTSANLSVFKNGLPQLCQNLSVGIKDLSQDKDSFSNLAEQMKSVLEFAHSIAGSQQLTLIVAAVCNSEKLSTIAGRIKHSLNDVTIEQIDQSKLVEQYGIQVADGQEVPFFALSSALTTFGVCEYDGQLNLVSQQSFNIQKAQKEISLTAKAVVAVILLSVTALVPLKMKMKSVKADLIEMKAKVTEMNPIRDKINDSKRQMSKLKRKLSAYSVASNELTSNPWPEVLSVIGDAVPSGVRIGDISTTNKGGFTLFGQALAESYVYKFAKKLQDKELVECAEVEEIEYDDNSTSIIVEYKITGQIRLPGSNL